MRRVTSASSGNPQSSDTRSIGPSDATAVTPSNPFYTLAFAVTGKMIGGREVNRQHITREEALIAHTRSNAYFLFQESNLGSLANGKYADLLVLELDDRDSARVGNPEFAQDGERGHSVPPRRRGEPD